MQVRTETRADASTRAKLRAEGWPDSTCRIIQATALDGFLGDGTRVDIHCFDPRNLQRVKELIGHSRPWQPGYGDAPACCARSKTGCPSMFTSTTPPRRRLPHP